MSNSAAPPRKGAYSKHVQALHKDQLLKLQAKHGQEIDLLEDIRTFTKHKIALEKSYADGLLKLSSSHLNHRLPTIPDIQKGENEQVSPAKSAVYCTKDEGYEVAMNI